METVREVLEASLEILSDRTRWTQGKYARDTFNNDKTAGGNILNPSDDNAVKFCALGACYRSLDLQLGDQTMLFYDVFDALQDASNALYDTLITIVNDALGYEAVINCYHYAIEHCEVSSG